MFEEFKKKNLIKKLESETKNYKFSEIVKKNKDKISSDFDVYMAYFKRCINLEVNFEKDFFQPLFLKYYKKIDESYLVKMIEMREFYGLFKNRDIFSNLNDDLRLKILAKLYHTEAIASYREEPIEDLIKTEELIKLYKDDDELRKVLAGRINNATDEEIIKYVIIDEDIVFLLREEKLFNVFEKLNLSEKTVIKIYNKYDTIVNYIKENNTLLLLLKYDYTILQENYDKKTINNMIKILRKIDLQDKIEMYNANKEFFNDLYLNCQVLFENEQIFVAHILMNNKSFAKQLMSGHFINGSGSPEYFIDFDLFRIVLEKYGVDEFLELLKIYPLIGASEKKFRKVQSYGDHGFSEKNMHYNTHYTLENALLKTDDAYKLIDVDINYLFNIFNFTSDDYELKQRILELLYIRLSSNGLEEKYQELIPSVDIILEHLGDEVDVAPSYSMQSFSVNKYKVIKLLFNVEFIANNTTDDINNYIKNLYLKDMKNQKESNELQEEFCKLFENAYGNKALQVIKSRPGLNPLTINSFEIFRPEIINNFSEGFVHDLLSYYIKGFTNFLMISKDSENLNLFIDYYNCLTKIFGENVETMEKAFINFFYYRDLLKEVQNVTLTEKEQKNFISVISGNYNYHDIKSRDDLNNYDNIADRKLLSLLSSASNRYEYLNIICNDLFGMDYGVIAMSYSFVFTQLEQGVYRDFIDSLNENEKNVCEFLKFLFRAEDEFSTDDIKTFVNNMIDAGNLRNSISCVTLLNKVKSKEIEQVNMRLMSEENIERFVSDGYLKRMDDIDGVPIYCYHHNEKEEQLFTKYFLNHRTTLSLDHFYTAEPDSGASTISTWLNLEKDDDLNRDKSPFEIGAKNVHFYQLPGDTQIVASALGDGETSHMAKSVHAKGNKKNMQHTYAGIYPVGWRQATGDDSEIAFYRRHRDHKNVTNKNHGGAIVPNCLHELNKRSLAYAKEFNGIIICSYSEYRNYIKSQDNDVEGKKI